MKKIVQIHRLLYFIFCLFPLLFACKSGSKDNKNVEVTKNGEQVCVVLAHPDDETIISGTLAMLNSRGYPIKVVYVTSGDGGADETGQGLYGNALAEVREKEAEASLKAIGIKEPPVFLKYTDGSVPENVEDVQYKLFNLLNGIKPAIVISFGPEGITGNWDHRMTGFATDFVFDRTDFGKLLLHMAITEKHAPMFSNGVVVARQAITLHVDVSDFEAEKKQAIEAHPTQFNGGARFLYKLLIHNLSREEFIIARNRNANNLLQKF